LSHTYIYLLGVFLTAAVLTVAKGWQLVRQPETQRLVTLHIRTWTVWRR